MTALDILECSFLIDFIWYGERAENSRGWHW
jgi:hypothetical protein